MHFLHLTLLYCLLSFSSSAPSLTPSASPIKIVEPRPANVIFQSKDGGQTWQDISNGLPVNHQPEDFFAGETDLYLLANQEMYRSKSNLKTPVWEKENALDPRCNSIAFNRSGVIAFNYEGQVYQKISTGAWVPAYANVKKHLMRTVFETADGTILLGSDRGLFKSADQGQSWKQVQNGGWVMDMVEAGGVLVATSQKGIMRSTDKGEHWQLVISEGGVGIAVERIEGGFAAISYNTSIKARSIHISLDSGKTWRAIDEGLAPSMSISSIKQIGKYLVCGHPDGIFRSADMGKSWSMVHPSVATNKFMPIKILNTNFNDPGKVFKLYVSGYVVYAVARDSGC